jgi:lysophospholipase L1-like esterase
LRILRLLAFVLCLAPLAACSKMSSTSGTTTPTAPSGPPSAGSSLIYVGVGASDVLGIGSTSPCFVYEDCNGTGYVWVAARQLRSQGYTVSVSNVGIPAGVISRTFQDLGVQYGRTIGGNFIEQEMPFVNRAANIVTVFAGGNDVNTITAALGGGAGGSNANAYIDKMVQTFASDYVTLIAGIRARATTARIVVINLPNMAAMPYLASSSLAQKQAAQRISVGMTTTAINTLKDVTIVDLMCDPRLYQPGVISSDGFHPNDAGYQILGTEVVNAVTNPSYPAPKASCSQMSLY